MAKFHLGNLQAWDCSKRGEWKEILGPAVGSSLFRSERSKEVGCVETLYLSPCFRHFWENKQLPICNYKVKKPHVGTTANLANQVLKQSALMLLSKRLLWSFSSAPGEKNSRKNAKWIWNQGYRDSILSLSTQSCLYMPDLGDYLPSLHLYGQHLLNPYLRGKISPGNTLHGSGFLELHSHEKCPIDHVIFFVFLCLKPAGSSPETQYAPPLSFFFQICHCTKEAHEKKQLRPYQQALLRLQIQICAPAWSWVAGDLAGKGISWNVGTQKPEVRWLWGWQIGYASAHLEVTGSHLTWISQKDSRMRVSWLFMNEMTRWL